jgi:putative endonuclease
MSNANRFAQSRDLVSAGGKECATYIYYVYMMQSASRRALYIGMTNNLRKRIWQHKNHSFEGFTDDHNATRLVYWESFDDVANAIDREKQLKRWRREKKMWLIDRKNPDWRDLAADWFPKETQDPSTSLGMTQRQQLTGLKSEV